MSLRVLVIDDQTMVCSALATLLLLELDIEMRGQAGNGREALEVFGGMACSQDSAPAGTTCTRPVNMVLLDTEVSIMDDIAAYETIRTRFPGTRVLVLTTSGRPGYVQRSFDAGAGGFIVKDAPFEQLAEAIRRVSASHRVIDPTLAVETLSLGVSPLTEHEAEIPRCVAEDETLTDIASEFGLPRGTVYNYVSSVMLKMNACIRAQALRLATEKEWF